MRRARTRARVRTTLLALTAAALLATVAGLAWMLQLPYAGWSGPD